MERSTTEEAEAARISTDRGSRHKGRGYVCAHRRQSTVSTERTKGGCHMRARALLLMRLAARVGRKGGEVHLGCEGEEEKE